MIIMTFKHQSLRRPVAMNDISQDGSERVVTASWSSIHSFQLGLSPISKCYLFNFVKCFSIRRGLSTLKLITGKYMCCELKIFQRNFSEMLKLKTLSTVTKV